MAEPTKRLIEALAVSAELTQTDLSKVAARVMAQDLAAYPEGQVVRSLDRCRRELKQGQLTIAAVLERLDDGRPDPQEAWALIPQSEEASGVWTEEMRAAYGVVHAMIACGELIPARMAFIEAYRREVMKARDEHRAVLWSFTPGTDKSGRELVLIDAVEKGRISMDYAKVCLPYHRGDDGDETSSEVLARLLAAAQRGMRLTQMRALPAPGATA